MGDRRSGRATAFGVASYVVCGIYALIIALPFYYVIVSGFKDNAGIIGSPLGFPLSFDFGNFRRAFQQAQFGRAFAYSILVTAASEAIALALAFPASYAIGRFRLRVASWVSTLFSIGFLVPILPLLLSTYLLAARWGLLYYPLMLILFYPATRIPFSTLFLTPFVRSIPPSLEESAQIDGASRARVMMDIFVPLTMPGVFNVLVLNFIDFWNEYIFALVILDSNHRTIQVAVASLSADMNHYNFGVIAAGLIIVSLPVFIVFILFQERVMSGILAGALKE